LTADSQKLTAAARAIGGNLFALYDYTSNALQEIESFLKRSHKVIFALTVQEILDEHIANKLV
jgi:hypothetical protein